MVQESDLPRCQRVLVFLPHSDDGRYFGATLHFLNAAGGDSSCNAVKIVVVSPGYRGVPGTQSNKEKTEVRWRETLAWATTLGFREDQLLAFGADRTYVAEKGVDPDDQTRMNALINEFAPTMVFVPHMSDTAQYINYNSRMMVVNGVCHYLTERHRAGMRHGEVFLVEYPTKDVPLLPPSDKNVVVVFSDPKYANLKHRANECHVSQKPKMFDIMVRLLEGATTFGEVDDIRRLAGADHLIGNHLGDVKLDPMNSRVEQFGLSMLRVEGEGEELLIREERPVFPPTEGFLEQWFGEPVSP